MCPPSINPHRFLELSAVECYNILRDQLQHEDNLITQRLSWLMGSQAFLFTAYAIVLNGPERPKNALIGSLQDYLLGTLPAVGLLSAVLIYVSIIAGAIAMFNIHPLCAELLRRRCRPVSASPRTKAHAIYGICVAIPFAADFHHRLAFALESRVGPISSSFRPASALTPPYKSSFSMAD